MRHPSEYFIKYLITCDRPEARDNNWVRLAVDTIGYPAPGEEYLDSLREDLYANLPAGYSTNDRYNRPSVKFLRSEGIWTLHNPDKTVHEATKILVDVKARKIIEYLLLGRIEPKDAARKANSRLMAHYTAAVIRAFRHYYWNSELLRADDWVDFLEVYEKSEASKALSVVRSGPAMALHVTGFQQNMESKEMLSKMQEALYFDFMDWKTQPRSMGKTQAMTTLARTVAKVDVRLSEADSALRDSLRAFEAFRMEHAKKEVKGIAEVAPTGAFTESGLPMKELAPPPEDD